LRLKFFISICCVCLLTAGCKKDLPSLNINPNDSTEADPELIFKHSVRRGMTGYITSSNLEYNGISSWVMYFANRGGINPTVPYSSPPGGDAFWNETYIDAMSNAQVIIDLENPEIANLKAAALIWKVYLAHRVTDLWGAIPYSEALQGNPELNLAPSYDSQREVYEQMLSDLDIAIASFDPLEEAIKPEIDLLLGGEIDLWKRFANSLKFRLAMRVSVKDQNMAQEVLNNLSPSDLFESNETSAEFEFNSVFNNPLNEAGNIRFFEGEQYVNPSKFLVDKLLNTNGKFFMNNDRPLPLLSYSEVCFLMAEAAERGMWPGNSLDYLKEGIATHMEHMNLHNYSDHENITATEIQDYLNSITEASLEEIGTQKWLLLGYENVLEAYAELRRTGFPKLVDFDGEPINWDIFPKRLVYPNSEFTLNRDNYLEALDEQGADNINTPIWWAN